MGPKSLMVVYVDPQGWLVSRSHSGNCGRSSGFLIGALRVPQETRIKKPYSKTKTAAKIAPWEESERKFQPAVGPRLASNSSHQVPTHGDLRHNGG